MSSAIAGFAVTPSQRSSAPPFARPKPPVVGCLAPPPRQQKPAATPSPSAPASSRRNVLLGFLGAGAVHGLAELKKQASAPQEPWLACGIEPYSEEPLADSPAGRALYPRGTPRIQDVIQGALGDCYLLAAIIAVARKWPWRITQRIRVTGVDADGTAHFKVGLHSHPREGEAPRLNWICVSAKFPSPGSRGALWVSLFEKAFAKHNDAYKVVHPVLQGYAALDVGGLGQGLEALTGSSARTEFFGNATSSEGFILPRLPRGRLASLFKRPRTAGFVVFGNWTHQGAKLPDGNVAQVIDFADGARLLSMKDQHRMIMPPGGGEDICVYGHHAYAVLDVNAAGDMLVCNPHGRNPHTESASFWLPQRCVERMVVGYVATSR